MMISKNDLIALGFGGGQSSDVIRKAKRLMVNKGYGYYDNRRLGKVPLEAVEEILGLKINLENRGVNA